jgi:hypothetical protein
MESLHNPVEDFTRYPDPLGPGANGSGTAAEVAVEAQAPR